MPVTTVDHRAYFQGSVSSVTFALNAGSASGRLLVLWYLRRYGSWGGVTYAGTQVPEIGEWDGWRQYTMVAPATGSNNVVINLVANYSGAFLVATTFAGVDQVTPGGIVAFNRNYSIATGPATGASWTVPSGGMLYGVAFIEEGAAGTAVNLSAGNATTGFGEVGFHDSTGQWRAGYRTTSGPLSFSYSGNRIWRVWTMLLNEVVVAGPFTPNPHPRNFAPLLTQ